jgi:predicted DNA-binding transcriptional regulator AlpA
MTKRLTDLCARTPDSDRLLESLGWIGAAIDEVMEERTSRGGE